MTVQDYGPVERATRAELRRLGFRPVSDALAAVAVSLAQELDDAATDAKGMAAVSAQLRLVMNDAVKAGRKSGAKDKLDELNARRAVRRAAAG